MKPAEATPHSSIYLLLLAILDQLKHQVTVLAEKHDLTLMQAKTIYILESEIEAPMSALSTTLHCDASNVTGIADRLEAHGLVVRKQSKTDRRVMTLALTPAGVTLRKLMLREMAEFEAAELGHALTADETATLFGLLTKLVAPRS